MDSFRAQGGGVWRSILGRKKCATTKSEKKLVTQSPQNPEEKLKDMVHAADEPIIGSPLNKLKEPSVQHSSIARSNCSPQIIVEEAVDEEADAGNKNKKMSPKLAHKDCDIKTKDRTKKTSAWSKLSVGQFLRKKETGNKKLTYDDPFLSTITHNTILLPPIGHLKGLVLSHLKSLAVDGAWLDAEVMDYVGFLGLKKYGSDEKIGKIVLLPHSLCFYFGSDLNSWIENETVKSLSLQQITGKTEIIYFVLFLDNHFVLIKFNKMTPTEWTTTVFDPLENQANAQLITIGIELVSNIIEHKLKTLEPRVQHHNDWQRNATIKIPGGNCRDCGPGVLWTLEKELKAIERGFPMDYEKFVGQNLELYRHQVLMDLLLESDVGRLIIQKFSNDAHSIAKFVQCADDPIKHDAAANVDGNDVKPKAEK